jgi:hypothetical protein
MPFSRLVDYCGGSQKAVMESIDAFADMEAYYRPLCDSEGDFDPQRFSGFVELQKNNVKTAINQAGHDVSDFAKWVYEKKIFPLATVRWLPKILKNKKATQVFLKKGAVEAIKVLDRPDLSKALQDATLAQLAQALAEAINKIPFATAKELESDPTSDTNQALLEAQDALNTFIAKMCTWDFFSRKGAKARRLPKTEADLTTEITKITEGGSRRGLRIEGIEDGTDC